MGSSLALSTSNAEKIKRCQADPGRLSHQSCGDPPLPLTHTLGQSFAQKLGPDCLFVLPFSVSLRIVTQTGEAKLRSVRNTAGIY